MAEIEKPEEAASERSQDRSAFSWPSRRRSQQAAEAADRAALQGLDRLRAKSAGEETGAPESIPPEPDDGDVLRKLVFEATEQLRDSIKMEANEIAELLRAERASLDEAISSLQALIAQARDGDPVRSEVAEDVAEDSERPLPVEGVVVDLNEATHADLCAAGMSETQASRVIRHRDFWGEFHSVSELDHVPGFTPELRAELDQRLTVGTGDEPAAEPAADG